MPSGIGASAPASIPARVSANEPLEELAAFEHKSRRRDVLLGPEAIYSFYDARLPPNVCNGPSFEKWRRKAERRNPDVLRMQRSNVMRTGATLADAEAYPDSIDMSGLRLPPSARSNSRGPGCGRRWAGWATPA